MAERRMNLAALQQRDPYITEIVDKASQVALYSFNSKDEKWEKTSIEGSMFIYKRSAFPLKGFMILNRLGLNNLVEPITKDLEFELRDPFLLYRNAKSIYGVWFFDKDDCVRLGGLLNSHVQSLLEDQNRQPEASPNPVTGATISESMRDSGKMAAQAGPTQSQVDIMQMLSKAQQEYDTQGTVSGVFGKKTEPKPMIDNPNASATKKASSIIRPKPLKMPDTEEKKEAEETAATGTPLTAGTISLDTLFRTASLQQGAPSFPAPGTKPPTILQRSTSIPGSSGSMSADFGGGDERADGSDELPSLLKHIMSTGSMVEDIERDHITQDDIMSAPILPDLTQPPPNHPAYRGPSPHTQTLTQTHQQTHTQKMRKSPKQTKSSSKDAVVFGLCDESGFGSKSGLSTGQGSRSSQNILAGNLIGPSPGSVPCQSVSVSQSTSIQIPSSETIYKGMGSPRSQGDSFTKEKPQPSPPIAKQVGLLTPADLLQPSGSLFQSQTEKPANPNLATAAASLSTELLSPMAFLTSTTVRKTPPVSTVPALQEKPPAEEKPSSQDPLPIAALTKEQLQQALLHLIKNDSNFISTIHEAYLKSITGLASKKS